MAARAPPLAEDADAHTHWRRVRAKVLAHLGELDEASASAARRWRSHRLPTSSAASTGLADLAEVLRLADRGEESRALVEEAPGLYEQRGNLVAAGRLQARLTEPPIEV